MTLNGASVPFSAWQLEDLLPQMEQSLVLVLLTHRHALDDPGVELLVAPTKKELAKRNKNTVVS